MKALPSNIATNVTLPITVPFYLIYLGFSTPLYLSSRQAVTYGGNSYTRNGIVVKSVSESDVVVGMDNTDLSATAIVLGEGVRDKSIKIYKAYGTAVALTADDVTLMFDGYMGNVSNITHNEAEIRCTYSSEALATAPRIYCSPPLCNHVPPTGTKLGTYTLERR